MALALNPRETHQNRQNVHGFQVRTPICHIVPTRTLDGPNRQSPVFSERGQLSQAIPQFHVERILHRNERQSRDSNRSATNTGPMGKRHKTATGLVTGVGLNLLGRPEKLLNRYEKRFEKREKGSEKRSETRPKNV